MSDCRFRKMFSKPGGMIVLFGVTTLALLGNIAGITVGAKRSC